MDNIISYFSSHFSLGRSILTLDEPEDEIDISKPVSIFSIAKKYDLKTFFLRDSSFSGFIRFYKGCQELDIQGIFGIKLVICNDTIKKDDESRKTESVVTIWMKNSDSYKDLLRIYSKSHTEDFYYYGRSDWKTIINNWTDNLILSVDFYNGFTARNLLENHQCIPNFGQIKPFFEYSLMSLPFDSLIEKATDEYIKNNGFEKLNIHPILYYDYDSFKSFQVFRSINNRSFFTSPNIDFLSSPNFCWENYCKMQEIKFIK